MNKVSFFSLVAFALFGVSHSVRADYEGIDAAHQFWGSIEVDGLVALLSTHFDFREEAS